jgi:hypothetical protein
VTKIRGPSYYLPYVLTPLAFFALLGAVQYLILRQALFVAKSPIVATQQPPVAAPKGRRLPASLIIQ